MAVRTKICGITREQDAQFAVAAGAQALGFVFHPASPRYIEPEQAQGIVGRLPPFVSVVGVFVDVELSALADIARRVPLDIVQLHGGETADYAKALTVPFIRALRVAPDTDIRQQAQAYPDAKAILVDTYVPGRPGGTGESFAWSMVPADMNKPLILAGGLTEDNVAQAIAKVQPFAVDVSSGVESEPGIKDHGKIERFIAAVRQAT